MAAIRSSLTGCVTLTCGAPIPGQPRTHPANTWGGGGLWARWREPGMQKSERCPLLYLHSLCLTRGGTWIWLSHHPDM